MSSNRQPVYLTAAQWAERFNPVVNEVGDGPSFLVDGKSFAFASDHPLFVSALDSMVDGVTEGLVIWSWVQDDDNDADYLVFDYCHDAMAYMLSIARPEEGEVVQVFFDEEEIAAFKANAAAA